MRTLFIILMTVYFLPQAFGCGNSRNKPAYMTESSVQCGYLFDSIEDPAFVINGKRHSFAYDLMDKAAHCPENEPGCFESMIKLSSQGHAICKAYGLGEYVQTFDYGYAEPQRMAVLVKERGLYHPKVADFHAPGTNYIWVKSIWCKSL